MKYFIKKNNAFIVFNTRAKNIVFALAMMTVPFVSHAQIANTGTQQKCTQTGTESAPLTGTRNSVWGAAGLDRSIDRKIYKRDIVAYKIKWSRPKPHWGDWIIKGVNDLYSYAPNASKPGTFNARLTWVYFYDHPHLYISCS